MMPNLNKLIDVATQYLEQSSKLMDHLETLEKGLMRMAKTMIENAIQEPADIDYDAEPEKIKNARLEHAKFEKETKEKLLEELSKILSDLG